MAGNRRSTAVAVTLLLALGAAACAVSPLGRRQLVLFPESEMSSMGVAAFDQMKQKIPVSSDAKMNTYVTCVANAVTRAMDQPGGHRVWEVLVFDDDSANAFALPGAKIGVHSGLLDVAKNQHQLATVIGHEIAHVVAHHSNERVSTSSLAQMGLAVASEVAGGGAGSQQIMALLGVGAQVGVLLPFGRTQESEADLIGLDLMARAGFDPRESIALWENMARARKGSQPPEFLSTHPSSTTRIGDLNKRMDTALSLYQKAVASGTKPNCRG